jgi:hypothetical protein
MERMKSVFHIYRSIRREEHFSTTTPTTTTTTTTRCLAADCT